MRLARFLVLSGLLLATASAPAAAGSFPAVSLQHLLRESDCEAVPELLGDWIAHDDLSGTWALQRLGERTYRLIEKAGESNNSNKGAFDICVAHLGGYLFFDATFQLMQPDGKKALLGEDDESLWIPLHLIGILEVENDALHFRLLDDDWLQDAMKSGRVDLTRSQNDEGQYILTAPSKELKQFAARLASDPRAFSYAEYFARAPRESTHQRQRHENSKTADQTGGVLREVGEQANKEVVIRRKGGSQDPRWRLKFEL
jgi:hypothetical protein